MQNAVSRQKIAVLRVLWLFDVVKRCDEEGCIAAKKKQIRAFDREYGQITATDCSIRE